MTTPIPRLYISIYLNNMTNMKLSHFEFELPDELLAERPAEHRDESRLMVLHRDTQKIEHRQFKDIIEYFDEKDVLLLNNTKVFPARLFGNKEKTGARIEVFLLRELNAEQRLWDVLVDPARKIRIGNKLYFGDDETLVAEVIDNTTSRGRTLRFLYDGSYEAFRTKLTQLGETPLPKYIKREVELGNFREDLYHRLNVFEINIEPLKNRVSDIPLLVKYFSKNLRKPVKMRISETVITPFRSQSSVSPE